MNRAIETRLRKLEANAPGRPVRCVWSTTSDPAEWDRKIAALITSGQANADDEFLTWMNDQAVPPRMRIRRTKARPC
jgi:hypothetical protein